MNEIEDYDKKKLIKNLVENKLFKGIIEDIKSELAMIMLESKDESRRQELYLEAKGLDTIVGHLIAIANQVRVSDG